MSKIDIQKYCFFLIESSSTSSSATANAGTQHQVSQEIYLSKTFPTYLKKPLISSHAKNFINMVLAHKEG